MGKKSSHHPQYFMVVSMCAHLRPQWLPIATLLSCPVQGIGPQRHLSKGGCVCVFLFMVAKGQEIGQNRTQLSRLTLMGGMDSRIIFRSSMV